MKGDSKLQAGLRDTMIKKGKNIYETPYVQKVLSVLDGHMNVVDIGCGTGHMLQQLACTSAFCVGLDISPAMLQVASSNTAGSNTLVFVEGDGLQLPFSTGVFDVVITRLAAFSADEVHRILKKDGYFFEYGLGPEANKEIVEFFGDRIDEEAFFFPRTKEWKREVCEYIRDLFVVLSVEDYQEKEYYQHEEELMDLIEMVPLVKDFDREKDKSTVEGLAKKYKTVNGIEITWHYYVLVAQAI